MADYSGTPLGTRGDDKLQSSASLTMIAAGPARGGSGSGSPTGSSRSYPKGGSVPLKPVDPMKDSKSTYGVGGV